MMQTDFWCTDWDGAAARHRQLYPQDNAALLQLADEICNNCFTFRGHWEMERTHAPVCFGDKIDWEHVENGDPEWMYAFNRHSFLVVLGKAWRCTGQPRYADTAARLWGAWIAEAPFTEAAKQTSWRSIETGLRCENWLLALALLGGSGQPDAGLMEKISASLMHHAEWLLQADTGFQKLSNWGVLQNHGLFLLGLAFENISWQKTALARLKEELHHQVMADGSHWEQSPLYHCEVLHCCLDVLLAARHSGVAVPEAVRQKTYAMSAALAAWLRPDGKLVCQSDSDEVDARDLLALAAMLFEDGALKTAAAGALYEENLWDFRDEDRTLYSALPLQTAAGSRALAHSGNIMMWDGEGTKAGFLHFHCGCLGSGHGHADLLHVDLVYNEESVLCDSGRYTYVDSLQRRALKSPAAHNCVTVDGEDFSIPRGSWGCQKLAEPLKGQHHFTPGADYAEGAHLGYLHLGVLHRRRVLRLGGGLWLLWDSFATMGDTLHTYRQYYHFAPTGRAELEENGAVFRSGAVGARVLFCGGEAALTMEEAQVSREYNKLEDTRRLCVEHSAPGFCSMATVVAVQAGGVPDVGAELLPVTLASAGNVLPPDKAQALRITHGGAQYTVILCHNEVISEVDMLRAGGCTGYGKVLVFGPDTPEGLCLAW